MADTDKTVAYGVSADASPFQKGMQDAADSAKNAASSIESNFKKVQDAFGQVQKQLVVLAGIVAGGAFFKDAINASAQLTGETMKLSRALGINAEQAATLRTALGDIGSNGDDYVATFTKFARQLKSNEQGMKDLGLQTRDANGNLRDSDTLFNEALQSVGKYKSGLDQNTYAQTLFGKSIDDVMKFQKLNNQVLEEARQKNEALGLTVSKDNVAASKAYKLAMNDVGDVLLAVKKTIGDAVMPIFTELAQYFASTGPYVVQVFKGAMMGLLTVFEVVRGAVKTVAGVVFEAFSLIVDGAGLIGEVFSKLFQGDFSGAYDAAKNVGKRVAQAFSGAFQNFLEAGNEIPNAIDAHAKRLYGSGGGVPGAPAGGSKTMGDFKSGSDGKDQSRMGGWEAELAETKLAYQEQNNLAGTFYQYSKQAELTFWRDKLAATEQGSAENIAVRRKLADLQLGINTDTYNHEIASLQAQEAAFKQNMSAKLALLNQQAELVRQRYGAESKEYEEVQKQIVAAKRHAIEQQKLIDMQRSESARNAQLAEVQLAEQQAQLEKDLHITTNADLLNQQRQFEQQRFVIQMQGLKEREQIAQNDPDRNPVELAKIHADIEELERQHQARIGQIQGAQTRESQKYVTGLYESLQSGLSGVLAKTMQGGLALSNIFRSLWQTVVQATTQALAQIAAEWLMKTLMAKVLGKTKAASEISANAGIAGSAAVASTAAIPLIGPELAPAAGAAAFSTAMAYQGVLASAAGGYDIPATINPLVQAHAREMILPAKHADVIRGMADGEGAAQASPTHLHVHAVDAQSVSRLFSNNADALVKVLNQRKRDFAY